MVVVVNPLIPSVGEEFGVATDGGLRLPQEGKIMGCPSTGGHAEDPAREGMHQEMQVQGVALLSPAVPVPLLCSGRSQGTSVTSTTTAVKTVPASVKVLFPGRENRPLCNSAFSTRTTVRRTVVSCIPHA